MYIVKPTVTQITNVFGIQSYQTENGSVGWKKDGFYCTSRLWAMVKLVQRVDLYSIAMAC